MRSFQQHLQEFQSRGTTIVAISVDSPEESRTLTRSQGYTFPLLSDAHADAIRSYGILHAHGGEEGRDIARPAEFLLDQGGIIRWENLTGNLLVRLRPETVLAAVASMKTSQ